jgi:DNA-binding NtrC family response regulator
VEFGSQFAARLLVIDDDPQQLDLIRASLEQFPLEILTATDPQQGLDLLSSEKPRIVLLDLVMPGLGGFEVLERILEIDPAVDVLLLTGHYTLESAVEAMKKGACDYIAKPLDLNSLRSKIDRLISKARRREEDVSLDSELKGEFRFAGIIGSNPRMREALRKIHRIAPYFRTVLLTGETGTGKELAAMALHRLSPAARGPFIAVNCSAIVETLFESELFGHVKGAFTGAIRDNAGILEAAHGGTVLLDEIGDLPAMLQAKLLRFLQNHEVHRVGSTATRTVDVRIIAATHRDIPGMVNEGTFRSDLYFRLAMTEIRIPSLRERPDDLPILTDHFVRSFARQYRKTIRSLTPRAKMALARHDWPGNVRELENAISHAAMMTETDSIDVLHLPERMRSVRVSPPREESFCSLREMERRYAREVMRGLGNKSRAAEVLGVSRTTLYRLLEDRNEFASERTVSGKDDAEKQRTQSAISVSNKIARR